MIVATAVHIPAIAVAVVDAAARPTPATTSSPVDWILVIHDEYELSHGRL